MYFILLITIGMPLIAGTPAVDGTFDGEATWGSPAATSDGVKGWSDVNVDKIYVTYDENYAYFAALFHSGGLPAGWMRIAFAVNVKSDGGWNCPWGAAVSYAYSPDDEKPDFALVARLQDDWAELRDWNGSDWGGSGVNVMANGDIAWAADFSCVEWRIAKTTLGDYDLCDVQFYVSGDNDTEHGVFDACPDDEVMSSWNNPTALDNYAADVVIGGPSAIDLPLKTQPDHYSLKQNYPNPFNPSTTIEYYLQEAGSVQLKVFNATGKTIADLVQDVQNPGTHKIKFYAGDLSNGIYFYTLKAGSFSQVRKMILMK